MIIGSWAKHSNHKNEVRILELKEVHGMQRAAVEVIAPLGGSYRAWVDICGFEVKTA